MQFSNPANSTIPVGLYVPLLEFNQLCLWPFPYSVPASVTITRNDRSLSAKYAVGRDRTNRVTYEVAVLEALREQLRCKEIWVVGANRYRNPDEDLPTDFEVNCDE